MSGAGQPHHPHPPALVHCSEVGHRPQVPAARMRGWTASCCPRTRAPPQLFLLRSEHPQAYRLVAPEQMRHAESFSLPGRAYAYMLQGASASPDLPALWLVSCPCVHTLARSRGERAGCKLWPCREPHARFVCACARVQLGGASLLPLGPTHHSQEAGPTTNQRQRQGPSPLGEGGLMGGVEGDGRRLERGVSKWWPFREQRARVVRACVLGQRGRASLPPLSPTLGLPDWDPERGPTSQAGRSSPARKRSCHRQLDSRHGSRPPHECAGGATRAAPPKGPPTTSKCL